MCAFGCASGLGSPVPVLVQFENVPLPRFALIGLIEMAEQNCKSQKKRRPFGLRTLNSSVAKLLIASAGRRNDSIHAQVFHHLPVMIKRVGHGKGSTEKLGSLSLAKGIGDKRQRRTL